jgi:uncharacterized Fe-S cluster-containing protein
VEFFCSLCGRKEDLPVTEAQVKKAMKADDAVIAALMRLAPKLDADQRYLILLGICKHCFEAMGRRNA